MIPGNKPLTEKMIGVLMNCVERELLNLEPNDAALLPAASGLLSLKLITTAPYFLQDGKKIMGVIVTAKAKEYLNAL